MGIISLEQANRLYWLGRYTERVYTTIRLYSRCYDAMIDDIGNNYEDFCRELEIPNIYKDKEDFNTRYPFDEEDCNSIFSNLVRAYDNAIVLRDEIGSETLSYVQLAIYDMNKAKISRAPLMELQNVVDNLLAFWGIADDYIASETTRNIIKAGKRIERLDMYARLKMEKSSLLREFHRMTTRLERSGMDYNKDNIPRIARLLEQPQLDYKAIVHEVESLVIE